MAMTMTREQWLAERRKGLGATDIAAVAGVHPWRRPIDVYLEKVEGVDAEESVRMRVGRIIEPFIASLYEERTGVKVQTLDMMRHPDLGWACASLDRMADAPLSRPVELKNVGYKDDQWGDEGSDVIPEYYVVQVAWQMLVSNRDIADLAALFAGHKFEIFHVERDADLEQELIEIGQEFWTKNILGRVPPEIDASSSWSQWLARKYKKDNALMLPATDELEQLMALEFRQRAWVAKGQEALDLIENKLKAAIGENAGIQGLVGKVTWKRSKDSKATEWEQVARELATRFAASLPGVDVDAHLKKIIEQFTTTKAGSRRLLVKPRKEK